MKSPPRSSSSLAGHTPAGQWVGASARSSWNVHLRRRTSSVCSRVAHGKYQVIPPVVHASRITQIDTIRIRHFESTSRFLRREPHHHVTTASGTTPVTGPLMIARQKRNVHRPSVLCAEFAPSGAPWLFFDGRTARRGPAQPSASLADENAFVRSRWSRKSCESTR